MVYYLERGDGETYLEDGGDQKVEVLVQPEDVFVGELLDVIWYLFDLDWEDFAFYDEGYQSFYVLGVTIAYFVVHFLVWGQKERLTVVILLLWDVIV